MAVDFKSGYVQAPQGKSVAQELGDAYARYSQIAQANKMQREQDNLTNFEEEVSSLFYNNSIVKGSLKNVNGNYSWDGKESIPDKKTARANYEYLAKKHGVKMDFAMSQQFDQLYNGMIQGYGTQLNNQIQNLISQGASLSDIQEAAMTPELSKVLNTLSNEGLAEFSNYLPKPSTMDNIVKKAQNLGTFGKSALAGTTVAGLGLASQYSKQAKSLMKGMPKTVASGLKLSGAGLLPGVGAGLGEAVAGDTGAVAGRTAGAIALAASTAGPKKLKRAAQTGFGKFLKTKLGKSAAKKLGIGATLSIIDGPMPFGEILSVLIGAGWTAMEVVQAYREYQQLK